LHVSLTTCGSYFLNSIDDHFVLCGIAKDIGCAGLYHKPPTPAINRSLISTLMQQKQGGKTEIFSFLAGCYENLTRGYDSLVVVSTQRNGEMHVLEGLRDQIPLCGTDLP